MSASNFNLTIHENSNAELLALTRTIAAQHALDPALVCAVVEQESAWDANAIRYEPAFRVRYVAPLGLPPTEEIARSISWGLMQVMGQVAREHGFTGKFLSALGDPAAGLGVGCAVLTSKFAAAARELAEAPPPASLAGPAAGQGITAGDTAREPAFASPGFPGGSVELQSRENTRDEFAASAPASGAASFPLSDSIPSSASDSAPAFSPASSASLASTLTHRALLLWNGGANPDYPAQVLARLANYK